MTRAFRYASSLVALSFGVAALAAQQPQPPQGQAAPAAPKAAAPAPSPNGRPAGVTLPPDYVIGPEDVLTIVFWRDTQMSGDFTVRPDGKISLPLLNDVQAAGSTPEELRARLAEAAAKYLQEPNPTVIVKEIKSRNVFITGNVARPGVYPLNAPISVLQLIAQAGGLLEYADKDRIVVIRNEGGRQRYYRFDYDDVIKRRRVEQNILLKPGDTVVVP
ncbi:MAG TPA: polysaccharide biosynthesis/export family protein [Vicinamibacterales bacterium]|nr:polysaccharide biosynthesis/export family protein [Vicinamibacterales bacterium]